MSINTCESTSSSSYKICMFGLIYFILSFTNATSSRLIRIGYAISGSPNSTDFSIKCYELLSSFSHTNYQP